MGNMTISETIQAQFYSALLISYGLTEEPARHEIFIVPIRMATYLQFDPQDLDYINDMNFYLYLHTEDRRKYEPWWYNFNLVAEGRTIQIWVPSNWKMRLPFAGHSLKIRAEDIMERNPELRLPVRILILDFDPTTSEEMENEDNAENVEQPEPRNEQNEGIVPQSPRNHFHHGF